MFEQTVYDLYNIEIWLTAICMHTEAMLRLLFPLNR
ncbi:hypothetical protein HDF26_000593 [Pedobacter cryoconitis]|uniref:Uncharacterized protein n=1 Tax=Pedobacter cryoconitis TaxID=188932 RepID=A0A7W8ZRW9_9SPHI|nr:hypothetical protein [Pedobacter cryoconitis]MBB6270166.1 hypothetical protein [Pedobacter cryoconitis]